jgi:hypothetical protein
VLPDGSVQIATGVRIVLPHDRTSDTGYCIYTRIRTETHTDARIKPRETMRTSFHT